MRVVKSAFAGSRFSRGDDADFFFAIFLHDRVDNQINT